MTLIPNSDNSSENRFSRFTELREAALSHQSLSPANSPLLSGQVASYFGDLRDLMFEIQRSGNLGDVFNAMERVWKISEKYKKSFWRKYLLFSPKLCINAIFQELNKQDSTSKLSKYVSQIEPWEMEASKQLHFWSWILVLITLTSLAFVFASLVINNSVLTVALIILFLLSLIVLFVLWSLKKKAYDKFIDEIEFSSIYKNIYQAVQECVESQSRLISRAQQLSSEIVNRVQEYEKQRIFDELDSDQQENFQRLEKERILNLSTLALSIARSQAIGRSEIQEIEQNRELAYMKAKLKVEDDAQDKERDHVVTLAFIRQQENILSEQAKILANQAGIDREMEREIKRKLSILEACGRNLQKGGRSAQPFVYADLARYTEQEAQFYSGQSEVLKDE